MHDFALFVSCVVGDYARGSGEHSETASFQAASVQPQASPQRAKACETLRAYTGLKVNGA